MFLIIVAILLLGWGTTVAVTWPGFRPQRLTIVGTSHVNPSVVKAAAHVSMLGNVWLLNPWALAQRVDMIPYVLSVDVHRTLPNRITLVVKERHPEGCLLSMYGKVTIDPTQRILENGCHGGIQYLLPNSKNMRVGSFITDDALSRLRADVAIVQAQHLQIVSADFDRDNGLVLHTRNGVTLLLGEDSVLAQTSSLLNPIFDSVKKQGREVSQIDLRAASTPVVRYKESKDKTEKSSSGT